MPWPVACGLGAAPLRRGGTKQPPARGEGRRRGAGGGLTRGGRSVFVSVAESYRQQQPAGVAKEMLNTRIAETGHTETRQQGEESTQQQTQEERHMREQATVTEVTIHERQPNQVYYCATAI